MMFVGFGFRLIILKATPFADEGCENNLSIRGTGKLLEDSKEFIFCTVHNHFVSFNMSPVCLGACMDLLQASH